MCPMMGASSGLATPRRATALRLEVAFLLGCLVTALLFGGPKQLNGGVPVPYQPMALGSSTARQSLLPPPLPPLLPWEPLLTAGQLRRGLAFYGSGQRIERVAARLLAGQPITAVTLGGSVTLGSGSSNQTARSKPNSYPERFFQYLNASFPHRDHVFLNKGIGATTSGIFSVCADKMLPEGSDLIVVELTFNEPADIPFTYPHRRGFEKMLRKLARLPHSPSIVVLHHYAWHFSQGDGLSSGLFYRAAEAQLGTLAQYYDFPSTSLRNALYYMMQQDVAPFKVGRVHKPGTVSHAGELLKAAGPKLQKDYLYYDAIHPSDTGHQAMAELLAGVVHTAVLNLVAEGKAPRPGQAAPAPEALELPPPMISGNAEAPTSLCAMQEDFKGLAKASSGFEYMAERPNGKTFMEQKWGWRGEEPGAWVELELDTQEAPGAEGNATVYLGFLRSYSGMGVARVECRRGCACQPSHADGLWEDRTSLMQMHSFQVTQHPSCVLRITIVDRASMPSSNSPSGGSTGNNASSAGSTGRGASGSVGGAAGADARSSKPSSGGTAGHKFQVAAAMVSHDAGTIVLEQYATQVTDLAAAAAASAGRR